MKWHSLLRNPNDLPQRINKYNNTVTFLLNSEENTYDLKLERKV